MPVIENVPEFRFNFFGNYTFTEGLMNGVGRGTRRLRHALLVRDGGFPFG
jgi:hypothetical protein